MNEPTTQQIGDAGRQLCSSALLDRMSLACAEAICYELGAELNAVRIRRVLEPLMKELQEISADWRSLASDRWHRADEWVSGDPMHAVRVAEATCLEHCANQVDAALRSNSVLGDGGAKPEIANELDQAT